MKENLEELFRGRQDNKAGSTTLHMGTLRSYGEQCAHITEFGVFNCFSTTAFLAARPKKLVGYDILRQPDVDLIEKIAREQTEAEFVFHLASSIEVEIEETDLLFVDSLHDYAQVKQELTLHGNKARKYLILHDTLERATSDETPSNNEVQGIIPALLEFLVKNPHWRVYDHYNFQYGLTILKRGG